VLEIALEPEVVAIRMVYVTGFPLRLYSISHRIPRCSNSNLGLSI